jgi:hypothetical protein
VCPHRVDYAPRTRSVRKEEEVAEPGFAIDGAGVAHDLWRVELANLAFPDTPHNATHAYGRSSFFGWGRLRAGIRG